MSATLPLDDSSLMSPPAEPGQSAVSRGMSMWSSRLFWKLFAAYVGLIVLLAVAFAVIVARWQRETLMEEFSTHLTETSQLLRNGLHEPLLWQEKPRLQAQFAQLTAESRFKATLLSEEGTVLASSPTEAPLQMADPALSRPVARGFVFPGTDPQSGQELLVHQHSLRSENQVLGVLLVGVPLRPIQQQILHIQLLIWLVAGGGAGSVIVLTYAMVGRIVDQLGRLIGGARALARGHYHHRVAVSSRDELGLLSQAFNRMSRELVRHTDELRQNGERLATVLGSMIEGVIAVDADENILFANHAAGGLLEFSTTNCVGRPLWEVVRNPVVQECVQDAFEQREPVRAEFEIHRTRRMVSLHLTRLPGDPPPGVVLVLHDVTELRRLENMRRDFVANVSHELKTPLTSISTYTETLLDGGALRDPEVNELFVQRIAEQAERLHDLIVDILSLARIESRPDDFEITTLKMDEIARSTIRRREESAEKKEIQLYAEFPAETIFVRAEKEGLRTVFDNLVDNAIKYTPQGGNVNVRVYCDGKWAVAEIQDTGMGIEPEHQARIFERFYRADRARTRELGGTGLGLAIVKHLVQAFKGTVSVSSEVGKGSTFTVRLPLA